MIKFNAVILFVLWSSHFFTPTLSDGNRSSRFKRKPYYYVSTPDIHVTFPAFDTQISPTKRYIDLSSNSIIRYTPVYQKQPVPTASNQHFERILNKIKNFKRKLKNYRRNHLTTPQYAAVPVDPLAITPIAVPAYDYFPVGPDYLSQYLQISHKYDRQSCIYLKISEDSFMKVQCYPILPHTDQVEVYPNTYNEVLSNPDVANVYNTLLPNAPEDSYPHSSLNDLHQLPGTSLGPYETIPYSNTYYHQSSPHQQPQYSVFTPHPIPHHFPIPPTFSPSSVPYTKYSKPSKVIIHANKTTLPLSITFPSKSNGLLSNFTDNKLTTVANTNEPNINRFPVDTKSEMTDNDSPTKISLLNHAIVPLDIEPTEKLDTSKLFYHPDDTVVVVASTEKSSSSTVEPSPTPYELYIIPGLGITNPWDGTEFTQAPTSPSKRTTLSKSGKEDNMTNTIGVTQGISDKNVYGSTDKWSETTIPVGIYTEQAVEATTVPVKTSGTEDRVYDPVDLEVTSTIVTHPGVETAIYDNLFVTTVASRYTNIDTDLKQVPEVSIGYHTPITSEEKSLTTEKSDDNEEKTFTTAQTERIDSHVEYTTNSEVTFTESELRILTSTPFRKENFDYATIPASQSILSSEISREYFRPLITTLLDDRDTPPYTDNTKNEMLSTSVTSFTDEYETSTQDLRQLITGVRDSSATTTVESDDLRQLPSTTIESEFVKTTVEPNNLRNFPSGGVETTTIYSSSDYLKQFPTTTDYSFITTADSTPDDLRLLPSTTVDSFVPTTGEADYLKQLPYSTVDILERTIDELNDFKQSLRSTVDSYVTTTYGSNEFKQLPTSTVDTFETTTDGPNDFRQLPTGTVDTFETTTDGPNGFRQLPSSTVDTFETTTDGPNGFRQLPTSTVDTLETTDGLNVFKQLPTSTVDTFETTTDEPNYLRQMPTSTVDTFETTTDGPNDLRQLPTSTVYTFETTDGLNVFKQLPTSTVNTFETTTDEPNDLRQLPTSTVDTFETTTDGPNGFRQLSSSTVDTFETTTDGPNGFRQLLTGTVYSLERTTVDKSSNDLGQLPSSTVATFETTTDEPNDLRQLPTGTVDSLETTTVDSSSHDLRQVPSSTVATFETTTDEPNDLRQLPIGTVDSLETTTVDRSSDDLRQLPSSTVATFETTTDGPNDLRQLPTGTVDSLETTTVDRSSYDVRQLHSSTVATFETTTDGPNDLRQLPTGTVDSLETTTVDRSSDDLRQLPSSTVATFETTTDGPNDLRQLPTGTVDSLETTTVDRSSYDVRQLHSSTVATFETTTDTPNDLRQLPTVTGDSLETTTVDRSSYDLRQLPSSTVATFETTTDGPNGFRQLPTGTVYSLETTTVDKSSDDLRQLPSSTVATFETTTDAPNNLRQFPTGTVDSLETTTVDKSSDDLRQLPSSTVVTFETTTDEPNDLRQLPTGTVDSLETTTVDRSSYDVRQLHSSTVATFETTTDTPNDLRQLPTVTVDSLETTTVDRSSYDVRQLLPSSTVATFETTTDAPNDLRQLPTGTVYSLETTTVDRSSDDLRQLPSSTVVTFETTIDELYDLRQLPTGTVYSLETTTVDRSSDDLRQLPSSTIDSYVTTTDRDNEFRQLSTVTVDSLEITTVNRSSDDLQEFHYGPVDSSVTSSFELEHLRLTTINGTSYDFKHVGDATTEYFLTSPAHYGNISYDLRELPTTEKDIATTYSDKLLLKEVTTENDVRQLLPTANNDNDDIPSSTTDDTMTWFTSDLEDVSPSITFPSRALVTEENSDRHTTQSTTTFEVEEITEYREQLSATTTHLIESLEKSIEDNEIIPHQGFSGNTEVKGDSFFYNKLPLKVDKSNNLDVNSVVNHNNSSEQDKIKLDKNNILSLSSENIKGNYGPKIPLESDEGNIVKVLEKNSNTGNWEVQYYKVNANNTSLNSEDIDLPRRSDVLISDYDGYDNIDSEAGEQYEYDYRAKNNSTVEDLGKIPEKIYMRSLPNDEATKNTKDVGRKKRQETYNIKELEELSSSYEKMKENNSTVLSDIRNITQNNTENSNKTNINVNYLDDFLKITDQVRKYYEEKKELNRTKRGLESSVNEENNSSSLEKKTEKRTTNSLSIGRNKRLNGMNSTQPQRRYKRYVSSMTSITEITDNSVDIIDNNSTSENDLTKPTIKHFPVPELLLHNENSSPSNVEQTLINVRANGKDTLVNFLNPPSIKNSKYLNFKKTPNYNDLGTRQKKKINAKSFNASLFNIEYKIETTTTAFPQSGFNTQVFGERANKTYIYKHKNLTNVDIHEKSVFPVNISSILELQTTSNVENFRSENNTISSTSYQINSTEDIQIPNLDITSLLRKQNTSSVGSANDPTNGVLDKVKEAVQSVNKSHELKFTIGKLINATSPDVIYVPMYVDLLLVTLIMLLLVLLAFFVFLHYAEIMLLLVLLAFFVFLHYADSKYNKRYQFDTSVTYLNNAFESDRIIMQ